MKPEGNLNIPRLRRGRKRRRSDPQQSSGSSSSVNASWADRFASEEIHGGGSSRSYDHLLLLQQQQQQQQLRRASTNTMPEPWRLSYDPRLASGGGGGASGGEEAELASSAYLNSLMRRERVPVSFPRHLGQGLGGQEGGMSNILDPSLRTASPLIYPTYPSYEYEDNRRSITPVGLNGWHGANSVSYKIPQWF